MNLKEFEEFEKEKTKVFKYVIYKKRTEAEVRQKFKNEIDENTLDDIIEHFKEYGYINDYEFIEKQVHEYMLLKAMSIKEIKYKLYSKGLNKNLIDDYISKNYDELKEYENNSAEKLRNKKKAIMTEEEIKNYLYKKGYYSD
jgi:regulatory protein